MSKLTLNRKEYSNVTFTHRRLGLYKWTNTCRLMGSLRLRVGLNLLPLGISIAKGKLNEISPLLESTLALRGDITLNLITVEDITVLAIRIDRFKDVGIGVIDLDYGYELFRIVSEHWYWEETRVSIEPLLTKVTEDFMIGAIEHATVYVDDIDDFMDYIDNVKITLVLTFNFTEEHGVYVGYIMVTTEDMVNTVIIIEKVEECKLHLLTEYLIKHAEVHRSVWDKLLVG